MLTLTEIEKVVDGLTTEQKIELHRYLERSFEASNARRPPDRTHSVLDIAAIRLGSLVRPLDADADLLRNWPSITSRIHSV